MPPRRVLPIRTRPESGSTNPGAAAPTASASAGTKAPSAGGSSSGAAMTSGNTNGLISKKTPDKDGRIDGKKGEMPTEERSGKSGDTGKKNGKPVYEKTSEPAPSPPLEMKDTMVS